MARAWQLVGPAGEVWLATLTVGIQECRWFLSNTIPCASFTLLTGTYRSRPLTTTPSSAKPKWFLPPGGAQNRLSLSANSAQHFTGSGPVM